MADNDTPATPAGTTHTIRFEHAPAPAPQYEAAPQYEVESLAPERVAIGDETDARYMTPEAYAERLAVEKERGIMLALKKAGVPKEQRAEMAASLMEGKSKFRFVPADEVDSLRSTKAEYEKARPEAEQVAKYQALVQKIADDEYGALTEKQQKAFVNLLPKDPAERLQALRDLKASGVLTAEEVREIKQDVAEAAKSDEKKEPPKPASTLGPSGPNPPKPGGTLTELEQYEGLKSRGLDILAAQFRRTNERKIAAQLAARGGK